MKKAIFWFRRDLRLTDNTGLIKALKENQQVLAIFIFDDLILNELENDDPRVSFIYDELKKIDLALKSYGSGLKILKGNPKDVWSKLLMEESVSAVYTNKDYEPYALHRDSMVEKLLEQHSIDLIKTKDQVIFEGGEVLKDNGLPYHMFTPYKNKWLKKYQPSHEIETLKYDHFFKFNNNFPSRELLGFLPSKIKVKPYDLSGIGTYESERNFPWKDSGTCLGPHLRFGTVSIRELSVKTYTESPVLLSELIWREFFMQILFHYPKVVHENFKPKYNGIVWRNNKSEFEKWTLGKTGFPMVDAGMRELNATGYMHNRVRMVTAGFLCKHLLIDWRWGEAYFASKLLDYELSSNNGNWQWAAGTGCDAAPYFRIFNPIEQVKKFDRDLKYIKKWIPEFETLSYPQPMVVHKAARERALREYKIGIG